MKATLPLLSCLLLPLLCLAAPPAAKPFDEAHRFVFFAVLEGCYEDGLSTNDVAQVLSRTEKGYPMHFIYSCPLCMPALQAFEAYQARPARFFGVKSGASTFGPGLDQELRRQLNSEDTADRLSAINALVQRWIQRRLAAQRLPEAERAALQKALDEKRRQGMEALKRFKAGKTVNLFAAAYAGKEECAVCNGVVGMGLPPKSPR